MATFYGRAFHIILWYCCDDSLEVQLEYTDDWEKYRKPMIKIFLSCYLYTVSVWWRAISTRLRYLTGSLNPSTPLFPKWTEICAIFYYSKQVLKQLQNLCFCRHFWNTAEICCWGRRIGWMRWKTLFCFCLFFPTLNVQYKNKDKRQ